MSFCLECGSPLPVQMVINLQDNQKTQSLPGGASTNPYPNQETETVVGNQIRPGQNFQQGQQFPPQRPKTNTKMFLVIGGIGSLFLLFAVAGAAIIGYNIIRPKPTPYPTPYPAFSPTRSTSPTPKFSPTTSYSPTPVYTPSSPPATNSANPPSLKFERIWVDFNTFADGKKGMRIHINFLIYNLKGVDLYTVVSFQKKDGTRLLSNSNNTRYRGKNGEVITYDGFKPIGDAIQFSDFQVFLPYEELNLPPGKYDLVMSANVIYQNGTLIGNLTNYNFQYEDAGTR